MVWVLVQVWLVPDGDHGVGPWSRSLHSVWCGSWCWSFLVLLVFLTSEQKRDDDRNNNRKSSVWIRLENNSGHNFDLNKPFWLHTDEAKCKLRGVVSCYHKLKTWVQIVCNCFMPLRASVRNPEDCGRKICFHVHFFPFLAAARQLRANFFLVRWVECNFVLICNPSQKW